MDMIVVYLWKSSDGLPSGHAAMKVEKNGESKYYSWWPSKGGRSTPPNYGPKGKSAEPSSHAENRERQIIDRQTMDMRVDPNGPQPLTTPVSSDKEMLSSVGMPPKSATVKFYFRGGLNVTAAENYWENLLATKSEYSDGTNNCTVPVANALVAALEASTGGIKVNDKNNQPSEKAIKDVIQYSKNSNMLKPKQTGNVNNVLKLCINVSKSLDESTSACSDSKVVVRHNLFDASNKTTKKLDYAPSQFMFTVDKQGTFLPTFEGAPASITPRDSAEHMRSDAQPDSTHFESSPSGNNNNNN
jgi:hypothetical protein